MSEVAKDENLILKRAEKLYEKERGAVEGRPAWKDLDPTDAYDMGMRQTAIDLATAELARYDELRGMVEEMQVGPAPTIENALKDLLAAVMAGDWEELEAGCDGTGPVVQAYRALEQPLPEEVVDYIDPEADADMDWDEDDEEEDEDGGVASEEGRAGSDE